MKKLIVLLMFLFILTGCAVQRNEKVITDINEHSNFTYPLLTVVTDEVKSDFNIMDGFGMYELIDPNCDPYNDDINLYMQDNPTTFYTVTAYPDFADGGSYITAIRTSDPSDPTLHIYDLSVGDIMTMDEITTYMATLGFSHDSDIASFYSKERTMLRVYLSEGVIIQLYVRIDIMNRMGMIF